MLTIQESRFDSLKYIISDKNTSNINHMPNTLIHSRAANNLTRFQAPNRAGGQDAVHVNKGQADKNKQNFVRENAREFTVVSEKTIVNRTSAIAMIAICSAPVN